MDVLNVSLIVTDNQRNIPLGLENNSSVFFNSIVQALAALPSFWGQVKHFNTDRPSDAYAVFNVDKLFGYIELSREQSHRPIRTLEYIQSLGMTGYACRKKQMWCWRMYGMWQTCFIHKLIT